MFLYLANFLKHLQKHLFYFCHNNNNGFACAEREEKRTQIHCRAIPLMMMLYTEYTVKPR